MSEALCPVCGKAAHSGAGFACSAEFRNERDTDPENTPKVGAGRTPEEQATKVGTPAALAGAARAAATKLLAGTFVGEYRIEEMVGAGGMGTVYRGVQPVIGKRVAIKVLSAVLAREDNAIKRFVLEARSVNEIGHPNLVDIFSFGQLTDGRYYYVMEYLEGQSLAKLIRQRGRLEPDETFPIFRDVGRALDAAHGKGIVHRDLKPDNVMLLPPATKSGETTIAKLLDFGLAKLLETGAGAGTGGAAAGPHTQAGMAVGTPPYMAPEQCMGKPVDARADIYALGVMLFESLCGRLPFEGKTMLEVWQGHVHRRPPRPSDLQPSSISPELEALILKALEKDPAARFQTAGEFVDALTEIAAAQGAPPRKRRRLSDKLPLLGRRRPPPPPPEALHAKRPPPGPRPPPPPDLLLPTPDSAEADASGQTPPSLAPLSQAIDAGRLSELVSIDGARAARPPRSPAPAVLPRADEVSVLRAALGLSIVEPAFETGNPSQASALDIELGARLRPGVRTPTLPPIVMPQGPIEERTRVSAVKSLSDVRPVPPLPPPLDPPRPSRPVETKSHARRVGGPSTRLALILLGLLAAMAVAWKLLAR